jgi:hypothetical protein
LAGAFVVSIGGRIDRLQLALESVVCAVPPADMPICGYADMRGKVKNFPARRLDAPHTDPAV